jgi:transcriptional regulator with XRE-family HTH domain
MRVNIVDIEGVSTRAAQPTGSPSPARVADSAAPLGAALRSLRRARRLSLQEVAEATAISASFLSLVETGKSDITIGRLVRLVEFYGVTLAELIPSAAQSEGDVVRATDRRLLRSPAEGIDVYMLAPDTDRAMMPMLLELEPLAQLAEFGHHRGEEWVYVIEGRLALTLASEPPRYLEEGDSAYYPAWRPHLFANPDPNRRLRIVCVDTPPNL